MAKVIIELKGGQTIPLNVLDGTASHTFTGFGVDRPVTVFQNGVSTIDIEKKEWPIRLDINNPHVSGEDAGMSAVNEIRIVQW